MILADVIPEVFSCGPDLASIDDAFQVFGGTLVMLFVLIFCVARDVAASD